MNNKKSTRRALLASILSLVLCMTMLIGTTFAWFTDNVTSAGNTIQSGKLDVDLVDKNGNSLEGEVLEFVDLDDNKLWEPGCTYNLQEVYVANKGNLALKYEVVINGITGDAKLLEAIEWTVTVGGVKTALSELKASLLPETKSEAIVLSGHMKEEAGNEYQDLKLEGISITVFATQLASENDTFGPDYDKDAVWADAYATSPAELADAIAEGGTVALMRDINLTTTSVARSATGAAITVAKGQNVTINLNGHNLIGVSAKDSGNQMAIKVNGNLNIVGKGTISMEHTGSNMEWNALTAAISVEGGTLTLGEGVKVIHNGGSDMSYAVDVNSTGGATTLNIDGAVLSSSYIGVRLFNNNKTAKATVNFNSGAIDAVKRDIWVHNPSAKAVDENAVVNIAEGYNYELTTQSAESFYGRIYDFNTVVTNDVASLDSSLNSGKDVVLTDNVSFSAKDTSNGSGYGQSGLTVNGNVFDGKGNTVTVTNAGATWDCSVYVKSGTIKNVTVSGAMRGIFTGGTNGDIYIDNVIFKNVIYTFNSDAGNKNYGVYISNSTLNGWTSFSNVHKEVVFTDCTFGEGSGYAFCRPYNASVFTNCVFEEGFEFDTSKVSGIVFENCYYGDTLITAENATTCGLFYNGLNGAVIK